LRDKIAVVTQNPILFNDSFMNNLLYANPLAGKKEIYEVCKELKLHEMIMGLPKQYDSVIGDQGSKLSGGQKQRLSFARAILKNAPILLLDEATNGLDAYNENIVLKVIEKLKHRCTIVFITHKLHISSIADQIIYFGKFGVENGNPNVLKKNKNS